MTPLQRRLVGTLPALVAIVTLGVAGVLAVLGFGTATAVVAVVGWCLLTPLSALVNEGVLDLDADRDGERTVEGRSRRSDPADLRDAGRPDRPRRPPA